MRGIEQIPWVYDAMMRVFEMFGLRRWREWLIAGIRGRTIEVGCGTGRNLPLYPRSSKLVAIDPAMEALEKARRRAPHVPLVRASAEALPFRDRTFDTVVSSLVFCSVPDPLKGLREARRVLEDQGELRMIEHVRSTSWLGARWQDAIQPLWTKVAGGCHPNRDTEANVTASGFRIHPSGRKAEKNLRRFAATKA